VARVNQRWNGGASSGAERAPDGFAGQAIFARLGRENGGTFMRDGLRPNHGRRNFPDGHPQENLGVAGGSPQRHVDRVGHRLGDRPGRPVLAASSELVKVLRREKRRGKNTSALRLTQAIMRATPSASPLLRPRARRGEGVRRFAPGPPWPPARRPRPDRDERLRECAPKRRPRS